MIENWKNLQDNTKLCKTRFRIFSFVLRLQKDRLHQVSITASFKGETRFKVEITVKNLQVMSDKPRTLNHLQL